MVIKVIEKLVHAGQNSITFTDSECDDTMIYDVFVNDLQLFPTDVTVSEHTVTINFKDATQDNLYIKIVVNALEGSLDASDIPYDATDTSLTSDNVEDAIDELDNNISANVADIEQLQLDVVAVQNQVDNLNAAAIPFDNTLSGMLSDDVQGAIEEAYNHGGGSQEVYDATERVIGTWFGKPLYRKCFIQNCTVETTSINHGIQNLGIIRSIESMFKRTSDSIWFGCNQSQGTGSGVIHLYTVCTGTQLNFIRSSTYGNGTAYITIEYTKTTD